MSKRKSSKEKKAMSREDIIRWRFEEMLRMAEEIDNYKYDHKEGLVPWLAREDKYLRVCGEKLVPVSVAIDTPLSGYGSGQCGSLDEALMRFKEKKANFVEPKTLKGKEERRLQADIIRLALQNGRSLKKAFRKPLNEFKDILFVLDEVSMGDSNHLNEEGLGASRCDLLCLARKGEQWLPLVVELKYKRMGKALIDQVNRYVVELASYRKELDRLLEAITGKSVAKGDIQKMVVMPTVENAQKDNARVQKTYREFENAGIHLIEYETEDLGFALYPVTPLEDCPQIVNANSTR